MARYWQPATKNFKYMLRAPPTTELDQLRSLIAISRQRLAGAINAELTRLHWSVGERLRTEVLGGADRAKYGDQRIKRVGDQLAQEFGRGFEAKNLRRMVQFAQTFPLPEIVATLSRQLSWSHFVKLLPLKTETARQFYASQAASNTWSGVSCATKSAARPSTAPSLPPCKPPPRYLRKSTANS